jgi:hypothetical protein
VADTPAFGFWHRFGGVGGAFANEVYRLHRLQVDSKLPDLPYSYYLIRVGMLIGAGLFAAAWEDNKPWKCFYLGVSIGIYIAIWSSVH